MDNDLTQFAGGTPAVGIRELDGYSLGDNSQHVNFIDGNGHVHELYRNPDPAAQWVDNDLTQFAGTTPAVGIRLSRKVFCAGHDRLFRPRMARSRAVSYLILRMVAAILVWPAWRISPMARLRRVAMMRGRGRVRTREASSR